MQREILVGTVTLAAVSHVTGKGTFFIGQDINLTVNGQLLLFDDINLRIERDALVQLYVDEKIVQPNGAFDVRLGKRLTFSFPERPGAYAGQDCLGYPEGIGGGYLSMLSLIIRRNDIVTIRTEATAAP